MKNFPRCIAASLVMVFLPVADAADPDKLDTKRKILKLSGKCVNPFCRSSHQKEGKPCEPLAPDVLDISVVGNEEEIEAGNIEIQVVLKPSRYASVELVTPDSPRLQGVAAAAEALNLQKGAPQPNEFQISYTKEKNRSENLAFTANLRNENGDLLANVTKVIKINEEVVAEGAANERVPVVIDSGGRRIVEYMTREAAEARGLTPAQPQPAPQKNSAEENEDAVEEEVAR